MNGPIVILSGGVGGAKFVEGMYHLAERPPLVAIVNTGDDFTHLGLHISPDIDSVLYALAGLSDRDRGWGRQDESWQCMGALRELGGPAWFQLGDRDLATHILRTDRLRAGHSLSDTTAHLTQAWGIDARVLPMSDDPVATIVTTDEGRLPFQRYFVERQCAPRLLGVEFEGAAKARPAPGAVEAIAEASAIFIAPSNPFLSVDPILAVPGIADALRESPAGKVAVSPLIGGRSIKGPTSKIMAELDLPESNAAIIAHYRGMIDGLVVDVSDELPADMPASHTSTLMRDLEDKRRVARCALALAGQLAR
ncbi:2-phospho-L-lactate transferase [Sphingobium sp. DEHP117]|uniref:2-phospho-L-lactate transferase n=1 Tax=Sphingobium sp. DEHP117 TaxID=2993436 RepID=UPI0027D5CB52|nr:2-phospho-L-lactate transferase [Sphingobium sp. DEHP117]MDQ4420348.1 2-phospho-L-lactate transferase [Sphingobium sp. DEHP117]